jgi:hypothetical protein
MCYPVTIMYYSGWCRSKGLDSFSSESPSDCQLCGPIDFMACIILPRRMLGELPSNNPQSRNYESFKCQQSNVRIFPVNSTVTTRDLNSNK